MADNELLLAISDMFDKKLQPIKDDLEIVKTDVNHLKNDVNYLKTDVNYLKTDVNYLKNDVNQLKNEAIKMQAMDEAILDEVERVHIILDKHKSDKSAHTA